MHIEGKRDSSIVLEQTTLNYIRRNVTLERVEEVERALSQWIPSSVFDTEGYLSNALMESVYRGHEGSFKIDFSKARGVGFLSLILYILLGEPKVDLPRVPGQEIVNKIKGVLKKRLKKNSYFLRFALTYLDLKTGDKTETGWINIDAYVYPLLGGEIYFYCTLRALMEISKNALTNEKYCFPRFINWKEGIVDYLVHEAISRLKTQEKRSL